MDGAGTKIFGYLLKNMSNNHALETKKYPKDVETALQIMMLFQEGAHKRLKPRRDTIKSRMSPQALLFAQMTKAEMMKKGLCFKCGKCGHGVNECKIKDVTSAVDGM